MLPWGFVVLLAVACVLFVFQIRQLSSACDRLEALAKQKGVRASEMERRAWTAENLASERGDELTKAASERTEWETQLAILKAEVDEERRRGVELLETAKQLSEAVTAKTRKRGADGRYEAQVAAKKARKPAG